jgi:apolipoprotein N-acyltransferase
LRWPVRVAVLPPAARGAAALLRALARGGLLWMCAAMLLNENLRGNTLAQIRTITTLFLAPEAAAWCLLIWFSARASIVDRQLVLTRGAHRLKLELADIVAVQLWRLPIPGSGLALRLADGRHYRLALARPDALAAALAATGGPQQQQQQQQQQQHRAVLQTYVQAGLSVRHSRLDHPLAAYALLPFLLAMPAFHLYQHIAYGSAFGEYYSFGLRAYLTAFGLWWAAWSIGVVLGSALLRAAIEAATLLAALVRPGRAADVKRSLERLRRVALYFGLPAWLLMRVYAL